MSSSGFTSELRADVAIVGGGLSGLTMAHALAVGGISVAVVDREDPVRAAQADFDGRTTALARACQRMYEALGLWDLMEAAACPILDIRVSDGGSRLFLHYDHEDVGDGPMGFIVENSAIREALMDKLGDRGITHVAPANVAAVVADQGGVSVDLSDGRQIRAMLAIGADGKFSPTREAAGIRSTRLGYGQSAVVCNVAHELPHNNVAHERFLPSGPLALLPLNGGCSSVVWSERDAVARALADMDEQTFNSELTHRFGDTLGALSLVGRRWCYPLSMSHAERYVGDRLALIADAAHAIHPIAGQGLNLGLRDIAVLAELLIEARGLGLDLGSAGLLQRYQRARRFDVTTMVASMDLLTRLFSNDVPALRAARRLGLGAVQRMPRLKKLFMRHAMGTLGELPSLLRGERPGTG